MSVASRAGSGDETTSANVVRNPSASVSGSSIVRSSGTKRIATPGLRSYVENATEAGLFRPGSGKNSFRAHGKTLRGFHFVAERLHL